MSPFSAGRPTVRRLLPAALALAVLAAGAAACASPARRFADRAALRGMRADIVAGTEFRHAVFRREGRRASRTLHVYLDGDGTPGLAGAPAPDPTPRDPLVLDLMALDPGPSVYLGRPCYHGAAAAPCAAPLWTRARYSETVVGSMAAALRRLLAGGAFDRVAFVGYSGGGTLAVLLAPRIAETVAVVTVAANLDIDAWTDLHAQPRLAGSLNPARQPALAPGIYQRHYVGGDDRLVPRAIVERGPVAPGSVVVLPGHDHACCWAASWRAVLEDLERVTGSGGERPGRRD